MNALHQSLPTATGGTPDGALWPELKGGEPLGPDRLDARAVELARAHAGHTRPATRRYDVLARLESNSRQLVANYRNTLAAAESGGWISPAGEWLLDNFHVISEQTRESRDNLPRSFYRELPELAAGAREGLPRVFVIALDLIACTDGLLDIAVLERFIGAYQSIEPLTIGELWALPTALRHAYLDRLASIASRVDDARKEREAATKLADELTEIALTHRGDVGEGLKSRVSRRVEPSTTMFATELAFRLRDRHPALALATSWIERRFEQQGTTLDDAIRAEHRSQAANQASVGNCIGAMRTITATDWSRFFESLSLVDRVLREDPAAAYARMDFATRDAYRHVVERIGKRARVGEVEIARHVVELARGAKTPRATHVGYWLVDAGLAELEVAVHCRPSLADRVARAVRRRATALYLVPILLGTMLVDAAVVWLARSSGAPDWALALLGALALAPASELTIALLHLWVTALVRPTPLPKLDYTDGIPANDATLVAVPMMLTNEHAIAEQLEALELRYLANQDPALSFALLADYTDAPTRETPFDAGLLGAITRGITRLNERYPDKPFFVFHRPRVWSESEHAFLGWERKRGKLDELNRLLLGIEGATMCVAGDAPIRLRKIRYVLTLDADTQLPLGTAARLIGTLAHPLNRAVVDERTGAITDGYALIQPRVSVSPPSAQLNRYTRLYTDEVGIDPYTSAVSDVYQDLFAEGSYVGKGLYDLRALTASLHGALPERRVLSHDLLEGLYARTALASDIELFDDAPTHYLAGGDRRHRWTRGDWQLIPWLLPSPPRADADQRPNPLSLIARWKIFDNLRRSLVAPATFLLLLAGWPTTRAPLVWSAGVALLCLFPLFGHLAAALARKPGRATLIVHLRHVLGGTARSGARAAVALLCLPHEAWSNVDAILRSLYRVHLSKRLLLEWTTAAQAERRAARTLAAFYRQMIAPVALAGLVVAASELGARGSARALAPIVVVWALAPLLMRWLSGALPDRQRKIRAIDRYFLRRIARKTWSYFDTFIGADDHDLPPDNFQESPQPLVAHRTSPTNLGLALLSYVTALDLGYLGLREALERIGRTLTSMEMLERHRGHFLNWYDTSSRAPLLPRYVSSVDSGNLAAMLITLQQAMLEGAKAPSTTTIAEGLGDTVRLVEEEISAAGIPALAQLQGRCTTMEALLDRAPVDPSARAAWLRDLDEEATAMHRGLTALGLSEAPCRGIVRWCTSLSAQIASHRRDEDVTGDALLGAAMTALGTRAELLMREMDFSFLFDRTRQLFAIGFDVASGHLDGSYYDLLASESRIGSLVAIAKGDVPVKHWYRLGRSLTQLHSRRALRSWTGTMFEYLMPSLLMRSYPGTLLDETAHAIVDRQIEYGREHHVPWGISESAYNARDLQLNYQYGPFGVPGLGLKRGLADDLVVAPYATMLALADAPRASVENLWHLSTEGLDGAYGFCESVDYTPSRVPEGQRGAVVRAYMAHHQGMSLLALAGYLGGQRMVERFHADPRIKATELLLQERIPYDVGIDELPDERDRKPRPPSPVERAEWRAFEPAAPPAVQLLSNGSYSVMLTAAGGGYSRRREMAVTRWREDPTLDTSGSLFYVRDLAGGQVWSPTHQPLRAADAAIDFCFSIDKAEFRRVDGDLETHLVVSVAAENDAEVRTLTFTNQGDRDRELEVTSYAEVVLTSPAADAAHPAFAKLFVETELHAWAGALVATRRPRSAKEVHPFAMHVSAVDETDGAPIEHETDRARFIGRARDLRTPAALDGALSGTVGAVLDPIFSLRRRLRVRAGSSMRVRFTTGVAETREEAFALAEKYADAATADRATALSWTHAQSQLHYLGIGAEEADLFRRVAAKIVYADRALRAKEEVIAANRRGQAGLWAYGISGDLPIVLARLEGEDHLELARELLHAHEYWRMRGLTVDLVLLNEHPPSYLQSFQDGLLGIVRAGPSARLIDKPGGIFVRRSDVMPPEDRTLLVASARVVFVGGRGDLSAQLDARSKHAPTLPAPFVPVRTQLRTAVSPAAAPALRFDNGLGGFSPDGKEYVVHLRPGQATPAPWINVLANRDFGATVSELGSGYVWAENSHENRLTAWSNDPVSDPSNMSIYLRDDDTGARVTPTPLPIRGAAAYTVRHGHGYTSFSSVQAELALDLTVFVAELDPVHLSRLTVRNTSTRARRLTIMPYVEWTLGVLREESAPHVVTAIDESGALFARNTYPNDLGSRVAFFDTVPRFRSCSGDRAEVLGRNGDATSPAALGRIALSDRTGAGYDPCGALMVGLTLGPGEEREIVVLLGQVVDATHARALLTRYREPGAAAQELARVRDRWDRTLEAIQIETPDDGLDLLVNGWLLYQVLACRMWARTGLYQSGGAYGYRDQLQDSAALVYSMPALAREHILRAASHQFVEGDAQHWWHPPSGRGVRTRFADDYLWLPFIAAHYVATTGDTGILDEQVAFIEARALTPEEHEAYLLPTRSDERASLFEHCARALDRSLAVGAHGLPLIGCGDWNDGMSRVGIEGRGESVWMAWFLIATIERTAPLCEARGETERAARYRAHAAALKAAVEANAWDGAWYLRAFFDDGTPLGSARSAECNIDSLSQSWSVISGAGDPARAATALDQVDARLVDRDASLVRLLVPAFDRGTLDPGYIKGYLPGVRENGGQYTHAAAWLVLAEIMRGHGDRAGELLHLLNPVHLTDTPERVARYRVEPYVLAADVYAVPPHVGRGGWTWYTGSASWFYRVVVESLLGLVVRGATLTIDPTIPARWPRFAMRYRHGTATYAITVENPDGVQHGVRTVSVDGTSVQGPITLVDDGATHAVHVVLGASPDRGG